jgi:hypothetical protein
VKKAVPIKVKAMSDYKIRIEYDDGVNGEIDLSKLAGKGVFKIWDDYRNFEKVYISEYGAIAWNEEIDICPDAQYMKLTGIKLEYA